MSLQFLQKSNCSDIPTFSAQNSGSETSSVLRELEESSFFDSDQNLNNTGHLSMPKQDSQANHTAYQNFGSYSSYQESLMAACSDLVESLNSQVGEYNNKTEEVPQRIKVERSPSFDQDEWISGFNAAVSTQPPTKPSIFVKEELQAGKLNVTSFQNYHIFSFLCCN